jgi:Fe2+ or Zn2+ uptake regulation protein
MNYDELPSRGKVTADGEKTKNHACGGRCYVFYDENRQYHVECEKCGTLVTFKARSLDWAIKIWNDMPDAIGL